MSNSHESAVVFVSFIEGSEEERQDKLDTFYNQSRVAQWADSRLKRYGDVVLPKHACITVPGIVRNGSASPNHSTFYVEHSGFIPSTEEIYHCHHVVCDCVMSRDFNDGLGGVNIEACTRMRQALNLQARRFGGENLPDTMYLGNEPSRIVFAAERFTIDAIEGTLAYDKVAPEAWPGTHKSGKLGVEQACEITGRAEDEIVWSAQWLQTAGRVFFDGQTIHRLH